MPAFADIVEHQSSGRIITVIKPVNETFADALDYQIYLLIS